MGDGRVKVTKNGGTCYHDEREGSKLVIAIFYYCILI
jgi:hypothetical protein